MCDFSGKLTAWIDGELLRDEALRLERHLDACPECRKRAAAYRDVSDAFAAYCDVAMAGSWPNRRRGWVAAAGATIAAGVLMALLFSRSRPETMMLHSPPTVPPPALAFQTAPARSPAIHPLHEAKVAARNPVRQIDEPELQIVLPAEAIFPPGALPDGFEFVANVSIQPDGSLAVGLRP